MPLILPYDSVRCQSGNLVIVSYDGNLKYSESKISHGGTVLGRKLHYLEFLQDGLCFFAGTRRNSLRKDGLQIIIRLDDIRYLPEFKRKVVALYSNGWLRADDIIWHKFYPDDDVTLFP